MSRECVRLYGLKRTYAPARRFCSPSMKSPTGSWLGVLKILCKKAINLHVLNEMFF